SLRFLILNQRRAEPIRKLDRAFRRVIRPRVNAARRCDKLIRSVNKYSVTHLKTTPPDPFDSRADVERRRIDDLPFEIARGRDQRGAFCGAGQLAFEADLPDKLDARRFDIGEINGVVDVALRVHVAPTDFDGLPILELVASNCLVRHKMADRKMADRKIGSGE